MATVESYVPADLSYYVWSFPGSPLKVHLALNVVRQLSEQLQLADLQAAGEGLLFGKAIEGATEVLDFQSAPGHVPETVAAPPAVTAVTRCSVMVVDVSVSQTWTTSPTFMPRASPLVK